MCEEKFGKGFIYNLLLFAKHWERAEHDIEAYKRTYKNTGIKPEAHALSVWFNGASDHLFCLEVPKQWENHRIGKLAKRLRNKILELGHGKRMLTNITREEFEKVFDDIERLTRMIDRELGVETRKAVYN